jgi:Zn-dependent M16 (insulinase) family peptidase
MFGCTVQHLIAFHRPFIDSPQPPPIAKTLVEVVEFPEEDESIGEVLVAWFGPSCVDQVQATAMNLLLTYLCGSSVSVLENIIVEKEELASSVSFSWDARPNSVIWMQPTGVATEKLAFVEQRLHALLQDVASKPLDMTYMKEIIGREKRQVQFQAEGTEAFYSSNLITDYLFGQRNGSTLLDLKSLGEYDTLMAWTDTDWRKFLSRWLVDANHISILGKPSMTLANRLKDAEESRLAKRRQELGPDGLKKCGERVEEAKEKNDRPIPEEVLSRWEVPGTESIHFIQSLTARSGRARQLGEPENTAQSRIDNVPQGMPLFIQWEDVPTNFVHITLHVGTSSIPTKLKPLVPLFADNFFNTPVMRDGVRIDFEDVVMQLEKETVSYAINGGGRIGDPEAMMMQYIIEPDKYEIIIRWIRTMMFDSIFDRVRIKACLMKALADLPESKRDGRAMAAEIEMAIHQTNDSFPLAKRTLVKALYLKRLKHWLEREPETVLSWFEDLRKSLFTFDNLRILVTANLKELQNPVATWDVLTKGMELSNMTTPIKLPFTLLSEEGKKPGNYGAVIIPMTTLDSSYSVSTATGLTSYADPRLPAYLVAIGYLEAVEGPLWNAVRGNGLAYGTYFSREINAGYIQYKVYRSPDASKAIDASKAAVEALATGKVPLDKHLVEGAVSGIVMAFADDQATMAAAAQQNFVIEVIRGLDANWTHDIMRQVRDVSHEDIRKVMHELVLPVFYPGTSNVVITCAPLMEQVSGYCNDQARA